MIHTITRVKLTKKAKPSDSAKQNSQLLTTECTKGTSMMRSLTVLVRVPCFLSDVNNTPNCIVTLTNYVGNRFEGEFVGEKLHGRVTKYEKSTSKVMNNWYQAGYTIKSEDVTNPTDAWYGDGQPIKNEDDTEKK